MWLRDRLSLLPHFTYHTCSGAITTSVDWPSQAKPPRAGVPRAVSTHTYTHTAHCLSQRLNLCPSEEQKLFLALSPLSSLPFLLPSFLPFLLFPSFLSFLLFPSLSLCTFLFPSSSFSSPFFLISWSFLSCLLPFLFPFFFLFPFSPSLLTLCPDSLQYHHTDPTLAPAVQLLPCGPLQGSMRCWMSSSDTVQPCAVSTDQEYGNQTI